MSDTSDRVNVFKVKLPVGGRYLRRLLEVVNEAGYEQRITAEEAPDGWWLVVEDNEDPFLQEKHA